MISNSSSSIEENIKNRNFIQEPPCLKNPFTSDEVLQCVLQKYIPNDIYNEILPDIIHFGNLAITSIAYDADLCEEYLPSLTPIRPWGQKVDEINVHEAWNRLKGMSAKEGLISIGYERKYKEFSRLYQFIKIFIFSSISIVSCPLAMTDGAARLVEVYGDNDLKNHAYSRLISRDPNVFTTSGQWMTERTGGSDVSRTSTVATKLINNENTKEIQQYFKDNERLYVLNGYKFFTSATLSGMSFALARINNNNDMKSGNRGLSCFYIPIKSLEKPKEFYHHFSNPNNSNGIHPSIKVHRLKDKLGTRAVPTAELELCNTPAYLVGQQSKGVSIISEMFNITRIHNAISSCSLIQRALFLAKDFAHKRFAFGKIIINHPLHVKTIADIQVEYEACTHVTFYCVYLLGMKECNKLNEKQKGLVRILMPLIKLYTAKAAVRNISEALECLGGVGYMEDSGMPRLFRDAQVLPIWEGTTNVLSLDVLRVLKRTPNVLNDFIDEIRNRINVFKQQKHLITKDLENVLIQLNTIIDSAKTMYFSISSSIKQEQIELIARDFSYALITSFCTSLLLEEIISSKHKETTINVVLLYAKNCLCDISPNIPSIKQFEINYGIAFGSRL